MKSSFVDELLDTLGRDGEVLVKGVDGAASLGHLEEKVGRKLGGRHFDFGGWGVRRLVVVCKWRQVGRNALYDGTSTMIV